MVSCKTLPQVDRVISTVHHGERRERGGGEMDVFKDDGFHLFLSHSCPVAELDTWNLFWLILSNVFSWVLMKPEPRDPVRSEWFLEVLLFVCVLQHEDGVVDLQGRSQLDWQDLDDVRLGEQQEGLAVYLLKGKGNKVVVVVLFCFFYRFWYWKNKILLTEVTDLHLPSLNLQ